jgi:hypothetical protein
MGAHVTWAWGGACPQVREILETGHFSRLDSLLATPLVATLVAFSKIWGVGMVTAQRLYSYGYRSIEDLRERGQHRLNEQQVIGLKYYEDIQQRIPRVEVAAVEAAVRAVAEDIMPGAVCMAAGSYRRYVWRCCCFCVCVCVRVCACVCARVLYVASFRDGLLPRPCQAAWLWSALVRSFAPLFTTCVRVACTCAHVPLGVPVCPWVCPCACGCAGARMIAVTLT